ncbi:autotransporter-associated beta strand repeat-containing protein [Synechococcus sp. UW140]|uniref:beta strand repeat-containing protein n=1 Tax=Synechococcus sp. UW140 TaxID=368503 RepID=UPI0015D0C11C|nr:autotransporter-associated beta strand repeat-containing protein [Synechococcus sp. UW140]
MSEFDTRGAIQGVSIESDGVRNLVLGVTAADGSFIDKSVSLTSPAHLFVLSPGGIQLMPGASFQQIPQLTLSTASQLRFGGGVFDVFSTPATGVAVLGGDPLPGALGLLPGALGEKRPWIRMDGISIDVDEALLVDAPGGRIDVEGSRLSVSNASGDGGTLTLMADDLVIDGTSQLLAKGSEDGGLIQVGGSWQNSDASVRQATTTRVDAGAVIDASATVHGDGGEIVVWSDISAPDSITDVAGTFLAKAGPQGGDGGRIETSGATLSLAPDLKIDASALDGEAGLWLQDPFNYVIDSPEAGTIESSLNGGTNVTISTAVNDPAGGSTGSGVGNISLNHPIEKTSGSPVTLTFLADNDVYLSGSIESTGDADALNVVAKAAGQIILDDGKAIETNGGDIVLWSNTGNKESGSGQHFIRLNPGSSLTSAGGKIVLAGGLDTNSDGVPDGYAYVGDVVRTAGSTFAGDPLQSGVSLGSVRNQTGARITISSGGGDVIMRGRSGVAHTQADGFGSQRAVVIDSGSGSIQIEGDQVATDGGVGLRFGNIDYLPDVAITSSSTSSPAIQIIGTSVSDRGVWLGDGYDAINVGTVLLQSTANSGGGITLEGSSSKTTGDTPGIDLGGSDSGSQNYQFLSNAGPIMLVSKRNTANSAINISANNIQLASRTTETAVQGVSPIVGSTSVATSFQADKKISFGSDVSGAGTVEIHPYSSGRTIGVESSSDLTLEGLDNLASSFSSVTVGDSNVNGIVSNSPIAVKSDAFFHSGSAGLNFSDTFTSNANNVSFQVATDSSVAALSLGSGSLTKIGSGRLKLTEANTYSGATHLNAGKLQLSNASALGSSSELNIDGGTLRFSQAASVPSASLASGGGTFEVDSGLTINFSSVASGSGAFTKTGLGTLNLSGTNTYTGATNVNAGSLKITGSLDETTTVTVGSGGTLKMGIDDVVGAIAGAGSIELGAYTLGVGANDSSTTFSGTISGTGGLTKFGTGTLTLAGDNTYSGASFVEAGTLSVSGSLSDASALTIVSGATYQLAKSDTVGSIAGEGAIELGDNTLSAGANNASTSFGGVISGTGNFRKVGTGTLVQSGDNDFTGSTFVDAGTLTVTGKGPTTATCGTGASSNICSKSTTTPTTPTDVATATTSTTSKSKSRSTSKVTALEPSSSSSLLIVLLDAYEEFVDVVLDVPSKMIGSPIFFVDAPQVNSIEASISDSIRLSPDLQASPAQGDPEDSKLKLE